MTDDNEVTPLLAAATNQQVPGAALLQQGSNPFSFVHGWIVLPSSNWLFVEAPASSRGGQTPGPLGHASCELSSQYHLTLGSRFPVSGGEFYAYTLPRTKHPASYPTLIMRDCPMLA